MEFGRVPENEMDAIRFSLPDEPALNNEILTACIDGKRKVYLGSAKWGRTEWVGKLYPLKTKEKDFLSHYKEHFNCIELNATHYKVYGEGAIAKWRDIGNKPDFIFCPKMYQGVTHRGSLRGKDFIVNEFFRGVAHFRENLGPILIQLSDSFSYNRREELYNFLNTLSKQFRYFLEVRHTSWFELPERRNELIGKLRSIGIGSVITDTMGRRDVVHTQISVPDVFIRFNITGTHRSDLSRMDEWVEKIKNWLDRGINEIYFIIHSHDESYTPEFAKYAVEQLNAKCKLSLPPIKFIQ